MQIKLKFRSQLIEATIPGNENIAAKIQHYQKLFKEAHDPKLSSTEKTKAVQQIKDLMPSLRKYFAEQVLKQLTTIILAEGMSFEEFEVVPGVTPTPGGANK